MSKEIDYYYVLVSPWSYMGHARFLEMAKRFGVKVNFKPLNAGKLFPATGGFVFKDRHPARLAYRLVELKRWNDHLNFGLKIEPKYFPVPDMAAACMTIQAGSLGHDMGPLSEAFMRAAWKEERNLADPKTLAAIANEQGLDGEALLAQSGEGSPAHRKWTENTDEAIARNVHGVPWYLYEDEPFWGQDRLDFLERRLAAAKSA
jgi:2-hydroxychromene-2-carboxylate isomerase